MDWSGIVVRIQRIILLFAAALAVALVASCAREQDSTAEPSPSDAKVASALGTPAPPSSPAPTSAGIPDVGAGTVADSSSVPQVYVVQAGDTLSSISRRFGCDLETLISANQITDPNLLRVGQELRIPSQEVGTGPALDLLPNSEFVNSPAYVGFDVSAFCGRQGGYLCTYEEKIGTEILTGPEIVNYVVHHYSIGPRLLQAVLEAKSGWVTNPNPSGAALSYPMGYTGAGWNTLHYQLAWAADKLNEGYYDWRGRGMDLKTWGDGTAIQYAPTLNAATAGLQYFFSLDATKSEWETWVGDGPDSFIATYRGLFGDPAQYAIEPLVPADAAIPPLSLPWSNGELWYYTGGPHGGWNDGSAWSAVDFVPDEGYLGCQVASSWATAAASGLVVYSQDGEVKIDLDEDGNEETGWVLFYLHLASEGRVPYGTRLKQGDPVGHPSCEGGFSEATHLHIARKYNGEWIAADGPLPLVLSGWQFRSGGVAYDGTASRNGEERTACECREATYNGLVADR